MKNFPKIMLVLVALMMGLVSRLAVATVMAVSVYYPVAKTGHTTISTSTQLFYTLSTLSWIGSAIYQLPAASKIRIGEVLPIVSSSWPEGLTPPKITMFDWTASGIDSSKCPGLDTTMWTCAKAQLHAEVQISSYAEYCPWVQLSYSTSVGEGEAAGYSWTSPVDRQKLSQCANIPVDAYDISWNPDFVQHDKILFFRSQDAKNDILETTMHTYLMESGHYCDGSVMDSRGGGCRVVVSGITLTPLGCDSPEVVATVTQHPVMDTVLHDVNVRVDISNLGAGEFNSVCSFRYLMDQL